MAIESPGHRASHAISAVWGATAPAPGVELQQSPTGQLSSVLLQLSCLTITTESKEQGQQSQRQARPDTEIAVSGGRIYLSSCAQALGTSSTAHRGRRSLARLGAAAPATTTSARRRRRRRIKPRGWSDSSHRRRAPGVEPRQLVGRCAGKPGLGWAGGAGLGRAGWHRLPALFLTAGRIGQLVLLLRRLLAWHACSSSSMNGLPPIMAVGPCPEDLLGLHATRLHAGASGKSRAPAGGLSAPPCASTRHPPPERAPGIVGKRSLLAGSAIDAQCDGSGGKLLRVPERTGRPG